MANKLQELLNEIRDPKLKQRLTGSFEELRKTKKFGLVFEEHLPELLPIYSAKIRRHSRVARKTGLLTETFAVEEILTTLRQSGPSKVKAAAHKTCPSTSW